jgi:hypothetical protein
MEEELLTNFNNLINEKNEEVEMILNSKNKKMTTKSLDLDYNAKKTIQKINAEADKKLKNSKAYKKEQSKIIQNGS